MKNVKELMEKIICKGEETANRTGISTITLFGEQLRFDLSKGFPAVTTKKLYFNSVAAELAGFLEGATDNERFKELGTNIWSKNAQDFYEKGFSDSVNYLGPIYGAIWRNFNGIDQLQDAVDQIQWTPHSRRIIVSAWSPSDIPKMCLPPCHIMYQFNVRGPKLDCMVYMRSVDVFLGLPFDIASYALLTHIVAQETNLEVGELIFSLGNTHIYTNHLQQVKTQLERPCKKLPSLDLNIAATIDTFHPSMATLRGYDHHPEIKAEMAI